MESRGGHVALLVPLVMVAAGQSRAESRWCATFPSPNNTHNGRIKCEVETDSCFAHFNSGIGGCWKDSGAEICKNPTCILSSPNFFCCCHGNMCNINITKAPVITTTSPPTEEPQIQMASAFIILGCVIAAALLFLAVFYLLHMFLARRKEKRREDMEKGDLHKDFSQLQLLQVVGRGCYGNVWMGQLVDQCAAVKQLSLNNRQNFLNERDIYKLPMMEHENIARFIDATERQLPGKAPELLIILEYYPLGSLNNFLKHKSCNWPEACRMAHSITRGLSYLHTERWHSGLYKPAIAHRDLNGRNVLVHSDGTCAISDFGMAMALSRPFSRPLEEETAAIAEVGTYRYMAPEVLDGAINLSDHQTALKQVDVYALGLMYWELFSRCSDIFSGHVAPPFSLAFEAELGSHPTFDEMQQLVARERHRPVFPASWQDDPLALAYLKLVIEECWEQDAEARLTACCAEERMKELGELRPLCLSIDNVENTRLIPLQNLEKHLTPLNESSPKDPSLLSKLPMIPDSCHNGHSIADIPVTRSDLRPPQRSSPASRDHPPVSPADILAYIQRKRGELGMTVKGLNEKLHDGVVDGQGKCVHSAGMITNKVPSLCTTREVNFYYLTHHTHFG